MSDDRYKPLWPWIVSLLIGLPVLYVASFGPACWITSRLNFGARSISVIYRPIACISFGDPENDGIPSAPALIVAHSRFGNPASKALYWAFRWYAELAAGPNWAWGSSVSGEGSLYGPWEWTPYK